MNKKKKCGVVAAGAGLIALILELFGIPVAAPLIEGINQVCEALTEEEAPAEIEESA